MNIVWKLFNESVETRRVFVKLSDDPKRKTSVRLGVRSIFFSILVVLFCATFGLGFRLFSSLQNAEVGLMFITLLGGIACVSAGVLGAFTNFFGAVTASRYQNKLNKKAIGWISSALLCLNTVAGVVIGLIVAGVIS